LKIIILKVVLPLNTGGYEWGYEPTGPGVIVLKGDKLFLLGSLFMDDSDINFLNFIHSFNFIN